MTGQIPHIEETYPELNVPLNGRYQVIEILAVQTWMRTYLAQDLHRPSKPECLIQHFKIIPTVPHYTGMVEDLFVGEAAALEYLGTHPQIPQLLACFQDSNGFYLVHEWIEGISLEAELRSHPCWSAAAIVQLLHSVLEPLAFVHQVGSIHGNLNPSHLLRRQRDGQWILVDFNGMQQIQMALETAYGLETPMTIALQQVYYPPEQLQGLVCPASDVYALGMIAIQALTGKHPSDFQMNPQTAEILWKEHLTPDTIATHKELIALLGDMVQCDVTKRLATAHEVRIALEARLQEASKAIMPVLAISQEGVPLETPLLPILEKPIPAEEIREPKEVATEGISNRTIVPVVPNTSDAPEVTPVDPHAEDALVVAQSNHLDFVPKEQGLIPARARPVLRVSFGGMTVAATFAAVGWGLLNSVDWSENSLQTGQKSNQVTGASKDSQSQSRETLLQQWGKQWQKGMVQYRQAELAFNQKRWAEARQLATDMPNVPYWQNYGKRLARRAISQAEPESFQLLQAAYQSAQAKNFTEALTKLNQIVPGTSVEATAKTKVVEYREKQNIKAAADLQRAYDRATMRDFTKALTYLYQIPEGTPAYNLAQQKIQEYKYKEKVRAQSLIQAAENQAQQKQFIAAISALEALPSEVALNPDVTLRIDTYTNQLNSQANQTLQLAEQHLRSGNPDSAIEALKNVPIGTPAYAQAREKLIQLTGQPYQTIQQETPQTRPVSLQRSTLNPGDRLQGV